MGGDINECIDEWMYGLMYVCTGVWMYICMDGWVD